MKLYKTTIVIWSEYDTDNMDLQHLSADAQDGNAYCSRMDAELVETEADPEFDDTAESAWDSITRSRDGEPRLVILQQ